MTPITPNKAPTGCQFSFHHFHGDFSVNRTFVGGLMLSNIPMPPSSFSFMDIDSYHNTQKIETGGNMKLGD